MTGPIDEKQTELIQLLIGPTAYQWLQRRASTVARARGNRCGYSDIIRQLIYDAMEREEREERDRNWHRMHPK